MPFPTAGAMPGMTARTDSTPEKSVIWSTENAIHDINNAIIGSAAVDAGATPTTDLRPGLLLGKKTSDSKLYQWDAEASDGTELVAGVLYRPRPMLDSSGSAEDKDGHILLGRMGLIAGDLLIKGTALTSHADEHVARRQLAARGFVLDDENAGAARFVGAALADLEVTGTTLTPTTAQNGYRFFLSNVASVTVTLPTLEPGLVYEFVRVANEELVINSAAGDDIIVGNDASADSITFTTANEHIGARVKLESVRYGTTIKWLASIPVTPFGTDNTGLTYGIGT